MSDNVHEVEHDEDDDEIIVESTGFEQIPAELTLDTGPHGVSDGAYRLYGVLSNCGAKDRKSVPRRRKLQEKLGVKSVRTVDNRIDELEEKGWLLVTPRFREDAPGMTSNQYRLLMRPIRSEKDPRLLKHRRDVAAFEEEMRRRKASNAAKRRGEAEEPESAQVSTPEQNSARGVGAGAGDAGTPSHLVATPPSNEMPGGEGATGCEDPLATGCEGGVQLDAPSPVQTVAPQKPDSLDHPNGLEPTGSEDADASSGDAAATPSDAGQLPGMPKAERAPAHRPRRQRKRKATAPDPAQVTDDDMASSKPLPEAKIGSAANRVVKEFLAWFKAETGETRIPKAQQCAIALANEYVAPALVAGYTPREAWKALAAASRDPKGNIVDVWPPQITWRRALRGITSEATAAARRTGPASNLFVGGMDPSQMREMSEAAFG